MNKFIYIAITFFLATTLGVYATETAIDISSNTNLAAGTGITLTDDTLSCDLGIAIDTSEITDDTIDSADYAAGSIDAEHLAADIVDETKIADNGIDSEHYNDGSIDAVHLAADIIDETKIADNGIDSEHYNDDSIDAAHIDTINCGRSTTWDATNDEVDIDAEIYSESFSIVVKNATTTSNPAAAHPNLNAITITKVQCSDSAGTTTIQLDERAQATPFTGGTDILTAALACGTGIASTTAFDNAAIAANAYVSLDIDSVVSSTSTIITVFYTIND